MRGPIKPRKRGRCRAPGAGCRAPGAGLLLAVVIPVVGCSGSDATGPPPPLPIDEVEFAEELGIDLSQMEERPSGLWLLDEVEGEGPLVEEESELLVDYEGWLPNGLLFDSSLNGQPFAMVVAEGRVIPGFAEGVLGMREGGERLLLIPPGLAYGANPPAAVIPPNSWLVFRVYMRSVET